MKFDLHESWKPYLEAEFEKPYFKDLVNFVENEYKNYTCFPPANQIFNALNHCYFK